MFEILSNDDAKRFYGVYPTNVSRVKRWIGTNIIRQRKDLGWSFAVLCDGEMVGYVDVNRGFKDIGSVSYCVDKNYWGRGIATADVKLLEDEIKDTPLVKLLIGVSKDNVGSERVAIKCGYIRKNADDKLVKTYAYYKEL
jgi:RimJ/RimL family protein N-acetyltransferase